jgi:pimeloyl-ACP methyl ester carboxylesterase
MAQPSTSDLAARPADAERPPCPAPAKILGEVARYDAAAEVRRWDGPRYRMTYRITGEGPPLVVVPGIASTYQIYAIFLNQIAQRFRTIIYDYPGEHTGDGARLGRITHEDLVDDLLGLIDHLKIGPSFLVGLSFGSTVALKALFQAPERFPRAAVQGAFAFRRFSAAERIALLLGRLVPGTVKRLPFHRLVLTYNSKPEFPAILGDRWPFYLEQNGATPIRSLAHRVKLLATLDLRPILGGISTETLLIQGREDRIVPLRDYELLASSMPKAHGMIVPTAGHMLHLTHAELEARIIAEWLTPCAPEGCTDEHGAAGIGCPLLAAGQCEGRPGCTAGAPAPAQ